MGFLVKACHPGGDGQGRKPRPRPSGLLSWPVTQKYDLSKPPLVTSGPTPPQASVGSTRVGGIEYSYMIVWLWFRIYHFDYLHHEVLETLHGWKYWGYLPMPKELGDLIMVEIRPGFTQEKPADLVLLMATMARRNV